MPKKGKRIQQSNQNNVQTILITEKNANVFSTVAAEWFENIKFKTKESTQNKYYNLLMQYILPSYGEQKLEEITYDVIESYSNRLLTAGGKTGGGLSPKTVNDVMVLLRSILRFASRKGMYVPFDGSSVQVKRTAKPIRVLSQYEQEQLCKYILAEPKGPKIGILICLFTGLRVGEICALRWEDVSFKEQTIYVHHTVQRLQTNCSDGPKTKIVMTTPKSASSIRIIPIPDELLAILIAYQKSTTGFLLTNDEMEFIEPRTMQNQFKYALKASGIEDVNFHVIRHTFATRCIEVGFDVKSLSEILGHANVNITMNRYVHPTLEMKKENMKKLVPFLDIK